MYAAATPLPSMTQAASFVSSAFQLESAHTTPVAW
jgi:hypothetical protein